MYAQAMNQKVMQLTVIGTGESLLRIQKRLSCAAAELGITLQVGIDKSPEAWGLTYVQTSAVMAQGKCLLTGLKRTEDIVTILRTWLAKNTSGCAGNAK